MTSSSSAELEREREEESESNARGTTGLESIELPGKILIADDDPAMRRLLEKTFSKYSHVLVAEDGAEALASLHAAHPDFLVTDLWMPNVDGLELIRRARGNFSGAGTPILMLTSEGDERSLIEAFRIGADDYLRKPFNREELLLRVSSIYLRQRRARDVNPLTRLPGNMMLKSEIQRRIEARDSLAIAYVDLDHFKAFNDYQGFDRGDHVIELLGNLLRDFAAQLEPGTVFIGHVGGDDFVVLLPIPEIEHLGTFIDEGFQRATADLYSPAERERGYYEAINRKNELEQFPLLSVSTGVLTTDREGMDDLRRVATVASEVKKMAKAIAGNSIFIDRRSR